MQRKLFLPCKDGLVLKNGELVAWKTLRPSFATLNYNVENNLFISLATCYGAYIFKAVDLLDRIPFAEFIGPVEEIPAGEIEVDWTEYFNILLSKKSFFDAIIGLNGFQTNFRYAFFTAEQIFDRYSKVYLSAFSSRKERREKVMSLHRRVKEFPGLKEQYTAHQLNDIFKLYVTNQKQVIERIKDYFMLRSDKLPF